MKEQHSEIRDGIYGIFARNPWLPLPLLPETLTVHTNMMQEESKETGLEVLDTMTLMSKKSVPN